MTSTQPTSLSSPVRRTLIAGAAAVGAALAMGAPAHAAPVVDAVPGFRAGSAQVNGTRIDYRIGGTGPAVVLLHGYAETGHMWNPLMPLLAKTHTVVVPDLRGAGNSSKPETGYGKKNMAVDIHELVRSLGIRSASIVGHDIGLMVAYAYAAQFPSETDRVVLMDAFLPGIGAWQNVWLLRDLWHFRFHGPTRLSRGCPCIACPSTHPDCRFARSFCCSTNRAARCFAW